MPILKCLECHHEWEGRRTRCDWCGAGSRVLKEESELEAMLRTLHRSLRSRALNILNKTKGPVDEK